MILEVLLCVPFFRSDVLNDCPSVEELKYLQSAGKRGEELEGWCVIVYTKAACYLENLPAFSNIKLGHANVIKQYLDRVKSSIKISISLGNSLFWCCSRSIQNLNSKKHMVPETAAKEQIACSFILLLLGPSQNLDP